jgi:uncharacterized iron-regulated protein
MNFKQSIESDRAREKKRAQLKLVAAVTLTCWSALAADGCGQGAQLAPTSGYTLTLGRDHPLTGRIFAGATQREATNEELERALAGAQLVLLGETHDNADHHLLQANLIERFAALHPHSAVAFEMLDEAQSDELRTIDDQAPDEIAKRVYWSESGWPPFPLYRPLFAAATRAHAALLAASPSADHVRSSMAGLSEAELDLLKLSEPLPDEQLRAQAAEIRESHCGHANDAMTTAMQRAQSFKDAFMAEKLLEAGRPVVLIAGRGHVRKDRGVPVFLARRGGKYSLSIALIDVQAKQRELGDYDIRAFDYAVFTPRVSDADPCEQFRQQLEHMRAQPAQ